MPIETLFFDLGNVLIDFNVEKMCQDIGHFCRLDSSQVKRVLFEKDLILKYETGAITSLDFFRTFSQIALAPITLEGLMEASSLNLSIKPEMLELIRQIKARGQTKLFILSNTCEAHFTYILKNGFSLLNLFDGYILSYEVRTRKPEREIFEIALKKAGAKKEHSFYVDDLIENVEAGREMGIDSHHFQKKQPLVHALQKRELL